MSNISNTVKSRKLIENEKKDYLMTLFEAKCGIEEIIKLLNASSKLHNYEVDVLLIINNKCRIQVDLEILQNRIRSDELMNKLHEQDNQ